MADDSQRAKARATFGKTFFEAAKPKPLAKNAATASQKVANSRPIPTYKDGGKVMAERVAARMAAGNYGKGGKVQTSADTARKLATEMGGMKDGGMKPVKKAVGGAGKTRKGMAPIKKKDGGVAKKAVGGQMVNRSLMKEDFRDAARDKMIAAKQASLAARMKKPALPSGSAQPAQGGTVPARKDGGTVKIDLIQAKRDTALRDAAAKKRAEAERYRRMMGSQEDILRRGERSQARDTEEYRSMKPVKRAMGGASGAAGEAERYRRMMRNPPLRPTGPPLPGPDGTWGPVSPPISPVNDIMQPPGGYDPRMKGGAQMMAKGGAGKVRKGMMTPKGDIKQAVKPKKGIGGFM